MAVKIMITDDHSMIREGLKSLLELDGDIEVIAEAENGTNAKPYEQSSQTDGWHSTFRGTLA